MKGTTTVNAAAIEGVAAVEAYLAKVPEPARSTLREDPRDIDQWPCAKDATECLSYGMPAFRYKGALGGLRGIQEALQLLPHAGVADRRDERRTEGLSDSKGTLQFAVDKPLPAALGKKMVKVRVVAENDEARIDDW